MIVLHAWQSLRQSFPVRKSEWVAAVVIFGISVVMLVNDDLFQESAGYNAMARFAPQWVWQWALFIVGFGRLTVLGINGAWWRTPHLRAVFALLSCFAWWQITIGLIGNVGIGFVAFGGYLVLEALNFRQAFIEAGVSEGLRIVERRDVRAKR